MIANNIASKESLENMAIAGATAAITFGITQGVSELTNSANVAGQTANAATSTTTLPAYDPNTINLTFNQASLTRGISPSALANVSVQSSTQTLTLADKFLSALQHSAIQTISSSAAQSAIKGDSLSEALKNSTRNLLINAAGEVIANNIGTSYKTNQINKTTQLALHSVLGCGMAAAGGNDCTAGAASGVIGETFGELIYNNGNGLNRQNTILASQVIGALTAAAVLGPDDGDSVFAGSQVGRNAVENNVLFYRAGTNSDPKKTDKEFIKSMEETTGQKVIVLSGTLENTDESRMLMANEMATAIKNYQLQPNEPLMVASHSHGENVTAIATNLDLGGKKIDVLVGLGGPQRNDYRFNFGAFAPDAKLINVYDVNDGVQRLGHIDFSLPEFFTQIISKPAQREVDGFINIPIEQTENSNYWNWRSGQIIHNKQTIGWFDSHVNLDTAPIWNNHVKPILQK